MNYKEVLFRLTESFNIIPVNFGTDDKCLNGKFKETTVGNKSLRVAYFLNNEIKVKILFYSDGVFAYGIQDNDKWILHPSKSNLSMNILSLFGKIIYITLEMMDTFNQHFIKFTGSEPSLDNLYKSLFKNKSFKHLLKNKGYDIKQEINKDGDYEFKIERFTDINVR